MDTKNNLLNDIAMRYCSQEVPPAPWLGDECSATPAALSRPAWSSKPMLVATNGGQKKALFHRPASTRNIKKPEVQSIGLCRMFFCMSPACRKNKKGKRWKRKKERGRKVRRKEERESRGGEYKQKDQVTRSICKPVTCVWTHPMSHAFDGQRRCNTSMEPPRQGLFGFCSDLAHLARSQRANVWQIFETRRTDSNSTRIQDLSKNGHTAALSKKCSLKRCSILPLFRKRYHLQSTLSERLSSHQRLTPIIQVHF